LWPRPKSAGPWRQRRVRVALGGDAAELAATIAAAAAAAVAPHNRRGWAPVAAAGDPRPPRPPSVWSVRVGCGGGGARWGQSSTARGDPTDDELGRGRAASAIGDKDDLAEASGCGQTIRTVSSPPPQPQSAASPPSTDGRRGATAGGSGRAEGSWTWRCRPSERYKRGGDGDWGASPRAGAGGELSGANGEGGARMGARGRMASKTPSKQDRRQLPPCCRRP